MLTEINGAITQRGNTSEMLFGVRDALSYLSSITLLKAGDLVLTGTPIGWDQNILRPGDTVVHHIEKVGNLEFSIAVN